MLNLEIAIPIVTDGGPVRLLTLFSITNQFGIVNRTSEVNGQVVNSGDIIMVSPIEATIDLSTKTRYTFQTIITGETVSGGSSCFGQDFYEFTAGDPLPPVFPTLAPSPSPSMTPAPSSDPDATACNLVSSIECDVTDFLEFSCDNLRAPTVRSCTNDNTLTDMRFQYTGAGIGQQQVYVEILARNNIFFSDFVNVGDTYDVVAPNGFTRGEIEIITCANEPDEDGDCDDLDEQTIDTTCGDDEVTLGASYGPHDLIAFSTDETGTQTLFATVLIEYIVENPSVFAARIDSAMVMSSFEGQRNLVPPPITVNRFRTEVIETENNDT